MCVGVGPAERKGVAGFSAKFAIGNSNDLREVRGLIAAWVLCVGHCGSSYDERRWSFVICWRVASYGIGAENKQYKYTSVCVYGCK